MSTIATFEGTVERVDDGRAYTLLVDEHGQWGTADFDAAELAAQGIGLGDEFRCVIEDNPRCLRFEFVPPRVPTDEEVAEVWCRAEELREMEVDYDA